MNRHLSIHLFNGFTFMHLADNYKTTYLHYTVGNTQQQHIIKGKYHKSNSQAYCCVLQMEKYFKTYDDW